MRRRDFLKTVGVAGATAALSGSDKLRALEEDRPNIVFILADDMGYGDLSYLNRDSQISTAHSDRIGREGMFFRDGHSPPALCTPTRYGILTGRYCFRTRITSGVLWGYSRHLIEPTRMRWPHC